MLNMLTRFATWFLIDGYLLVARTSSKIVPLSVVRVIIK
jgi:hypothetical protein